MQSLQEPLVTLIAELVQSINSSRLNLSVVPQQLQHAIELTAMAAGKVRPLSFNLCILQWTQHIQI